MIGVDTTIYRNCVRQKLKNRRVTVYKQEGDNNYLIEFSTLVVLKSEEERQQYLDLNCPTIKLVDRPHSKYVIWKNCIALTAEAMFCVGHAIMYLDKIETTLLKTKK